MNTAGYFKSVLAITSVLASTIVITGCSSPEGIPDADAPIGDGAVSDATPAAAREPISATAQSLIKEHLDTLEPMAKLGGRLFHDNRLSNPGANLATSCSSCHVPPFLSDGQRFYTDNTAVSVIPANANGGKVTSIRNTPTLLDAVTNTTFNADGAFTSLDEYLRHKLTSPHLGWASDRSEDAMNELHAMLLNDSGEDVFAEGSYIEQFKSVEKDLEALSQEEVIGASIEALSAYLGTITSTKTSSYDSMTFLNRFNDNMGANNDTPQALSGRLYGRIANEEGRVQIRFSNIFEEEAYQGFKTFIRVEPTFSSSVEGLEENLGNCLACHVTPKFSDGKFHNAGTAQLAYDATHGEGAFMKLDPASTTFGPISADEPNNVDLGRYNVEASEENVGAFKTPGLRNIALTAPYFHDGSAATLEDVIRQKIKISEMVKAGTLRNPDPEYLVMNISESDVPTLAAFLRTLNDVPEEEYRDYRIENVVIRQDLIEDATYEN